MSFWSGVIDYVHDIESVGIECNDDGVIECDDDDSVIENNDDDSVMEHNDENFIECIVVKRCI